MKRNISSRSKLQSSKITYCKIYLFGSTNALCTHLTYCCRYCPERDKCKSGGCAYLTFHPKCDHEISENEAARIIFDKQIFG